MRVSTVVAAVCLVLGVGVAGTSIMAGTTSPQVPKSKKAKHKEVPAGAPAKPSGPTVTADATDAYYGGPKLDTIKQSVNALGQTVYTISPSHVDVSPPLSDLAVLPAGKLAGEPETEISENPQLPAWRTVRSGVSDPVVQETPSPYTIESTGPGEQPLAPSTGFNFVGVGTNGLTPSDSNGAAGNNQFVEVVNTRYQVWSLNRSTKVATTLAGPSAINTLWMGFGGACQSQNSGDPIVVYDKVANRWLISQFTSTAVSGTYFQCVALSTSANAAGTYTRYAFAVPNGDFGDYPKFGVWTDAYYMMAHAFTSSSGSYVAAIFAAMDRTKMLAADPTATWQVIFDPSEGGHMPADLDGFAPPPTAAPGIFVSLHTTGMFVYRMKVDFNNSANTVRTLQATVPVAPSNAACGGGSCIPQPGTTQTVGSLADRLMFRAAYRNYVDHESLVVSHSVDPGVSGLVSGVRWYDFRLSGTPDATCASYPCIYEQGTIADTPGGRNRWMPSIAMDAGENIVVGYSTTGLTAGTDNQSVRYTGRAKTDPPGTMTVPEAIVVTGTANNNNGRWGDYTCMSVDPIDDCTLFYVNQYFTALGSWSTRISSALWPAGSGAGQCPAAGCTSRPTSAPVIGSATIPGNNQITVSWTGIVPTPGAYAIERADGVCGSEGMYRPLGSTAGTNTSFTDTTVQGGLNYSYRVIAASDASARCQATVVSACVSATATGTCNLKPSFAGASSASSNNQSNCGVNVSWTPSTSSCPLTPTMRYSVFRGTTPDFVPSAANRIATCVTGPSSYLDTASLASGSTYYYAVRAEDNSSGNGGDCNGGNEDANSIVVAGTAYGVGLQSSPATWTDGGGDGTAFLSLNVPGPGDTPTNTWRFVRTADDPGANHTPGGGYAYRNAGPGPSNIYLPDTCAEMQTPSLPAAASSVNLEYWERHQLEYHWDGVTVEYAIDGFEWNTVPAPSNDPAVGCASTDTTTGWETFACTQSPPVNACGYGTFINTYNGAFGSGSSCNDYVTASTVTAYAHRCHQITGLLPGDTIQFRWRFSSDPGAEYAGFYLDDIAVTNVTLPNACTPNTCTGQPDATACDPGVACTAGACSAGSCQASGPAPPPQEIAGVQVNGHSGTTVSWTASLSGAVSYDVVGATISSLQAGGTTGATCLANNLAVTSFVDGQPDPPAGDGYYYLVRAQSACGTGTYGNDSSGSPRSPASGCP
jgi:hypothetical protein